MTYSAYLGLCAPTPSLFWGLLWTFVHPSSSFTTFYLTAGWWCKLHKCGACTLILAAAFKKNLVQVKYEGKPIYLLNPCCIHEKACEVVNSARHMVGAARRVGENIEQLWSLLKASTRSLYKFFIYKNDYLCKYIAFYFCCLCTGGGSTKGGGPSVGVRVSDDNPLIYSPNGAYPQNMSSF